MHTRPMHTHPLCARTTRIYTAYVRTRSHTHESLSSTGTRLCAKACGDEASDRPDKTEHAAELGIWAWGRNGRQSGRAKKRGSSYRQPGFRLDRPGWVSWRRGLANLGHRGHLQGASPLSSQAQQGGSGSWDRPAMGMCASLWGQQPSRPLTHLVPNPAGLFQLADS